jgi:phage terminase large subunit-like protein
MAKSQEPNPTVVVSRATTYANKANLHPSYFETIISKYQGTRLGRQELMADILEEAEGAMWTRLMVEQSRDGRKSPYLRVVVAVDPAVSATASSALTGIIVAALGVDKRGYVIADLSGRYKPDEWARVVVNAYNTYGADKIIAEGNQGVHAAQRRRLRPARARRQPAAPDRALRGRAAARARGRSRARVLARDQTGLRATLTPQARG